MNISYRWLQSLLPGLNETPQQVADRLAMQGAPVDEIIDIGGPIRDVIIARVIERQQHPNADRLSLCRVDAGTGEELQVVCGATNVRTGGIYPFAPVGSSLPGGITLRKAKIRGMESQGMLCSARELALGRDHQGILELHGDLPIGASFIETMQLDDTRLVVDVTPNRPDLLSHLGVAREIGADLGIAPQLPASSTQLDYGSDFALSIEDAALCPRYLGLIIRGVKVGPSPEWLASRIRAIGSRPISNVVDATNYVLHELGQPLHAFDLDRLGNTVVVRNAKAGETVTTLDGVERKLRDDMLVIADAQRPVALAGVMGGADTEVQDDTANIFLECALFDPKSVRRTRRALDLSTDASYRFERGVDAANLERALLRCAELIAEIAGGTLESAVAAGPGVAAPKPIQLRLARVAQVLGRAFDAQEVRTLLEPLEFQVEGSGDTLTITVPGHRWHDVRDEIDFVEEIARRYGYDNFPTELRPFHPTAVPDDALLIAEDRLRDLLVARGFLEMRTAAFAPESEGDVALLLPLSAAEGRLRRALVPGLVHRVEFNFARGQRHIRAFEIGTAFAPGEPVPNEERRIALVMTGARTPHHWSGEGAAFDLWDLKSLVDEIAGELGIEARPGDADVAWIEPGTGLLLDGGWAGQVRASAVDAPPWADPVFALELRIRDTIGLRRPFRPLPAHPAVERDLALLVPQDLTAAQVLETVRGSAGPLLEALEPFDLYRGKGVPEGTRSLAIRLRFRAPDRTLTDAEVDSAVGRVLKRLREAHGIERRG